MKTVLIFLTVFVLLSANGLALAQEPNTQHAAFEVVRSSSLSIVKIEHTWERQEGNLIYRTTVPSLGTVVGPNTVLTHNHFGAALGTRPNETMTFTDSAGKATHVQLADLTLIAIDAGTMLIRLPDNVTLDSLPLADSATIDRLAVGDRLTVNYWDDVTNRFVQKDFQIIRVENDTATLADPNRLINPGDSGGGAYFEGKLVGNTWSMHLDQNGNPVGSFNVALLPPQVANRNQP